MVHQIIASQTVHVLIPRNCEYVKLHEKNGIKEAEGIQVANHLTQKKENFSGLREWAQCNHKGL